MNITRVGLFAVLTAVSSIPARAVDYAWSGFGTIGYARPNSDYVYERFAGRSGTFRRDSILGLQGSAEFNPHWTMTLQTLVDNSASDDHKTVLTLPWAFIAYQPTNGILLRVGSMRMPLYLYSESKNIGVSYAFMHLPTEVYSMAPTDDFTGAAFSKTQELSNGDLVLDGFAGVSEVDIRRLQNVTGGSVRSKLGGLMLSLHRHGDTFRAGLLHADIATSFTFSPMTGGAGPAPGEGAAPPASLGGMPPVGSGTANTFVYLLGADTDLGRGFHMIGELARRDANNVAFSKNSTGGYLSLQKKLEAWTPYVTLGRLLSDKAERQDPVGMHFYDDQSSLALGLAYSLSPASRFKLEWMQVEVLGGSTLFDPSPGGTGISRQDVDMWSASYSCAF